MGTEEYKAVIRRLNEEWWNQGRAEVLDEVFAADFLDHNAAPGQPPGREGLKRVNFALRAAMPDIRSTIEELLVDGDKVVWRWSTEGTHRGPLMGIPATGKRVTLAGITIDRIADGRIAERWNQWNTLGLLQQIGAIPAPG